MIEPTTSVRWSIDHADETHTCILGVEMADDGSRQAGRWLLDDVQKPIREVHVFAISLPHDATKAAQLAELGKAENATILAEAVKKLPTPVQLDVVEEGVK